MVRIGVFEAVEGAEIVFGKIRPPQGLQHQVTEQEGDIKCRIPEVRAFCIKNDRSIRATQDVFRAEISVDEAYAVCLEQVYEAP